MSKPLTIIVTGSSGLVGSALIKHLANSGNRIRAFQRRPPVLERSGVEYVHFNLADVRDEGYEGADILIHCAYQLAGSNNSREGGEDLDESAARAIIALSKKYGIKIIYLSSTSADDAAHSRYAKSKSKIERLFDINHDLILRLGLVVGGEGGLFGRLQANLRRFKIIPLLGGGRQRVQTLHLEDFCLVVDEAIEKKVVGVYSIAHPDGVFMHEIYKGISHTVGVRPYFISVPLGIAYGITHPLEKMGIKLPFASDNILGLYDLRIADVKQYYQRFSVPLRDWRSSLREYKVGDGASSHGDCSVVK